jgi:hypothetical protein
MILPNHLLPGSYAYRADRSHRDRRGLYSTGSIRRPDGTLIAVIVSHAGTPRRAPGRPQGLLPRAGRDFPFVQNGVSVKVRWPGIASFNGRAGTMDLYKAPVMDFLRCCPGWALQAIPAPGTSTNQGEACRFFCGEPEEELSLQWERGEGHDETIY